MKKCFAKLMRCVIPAMLVFIAAGCGKDPAAGDGSLEKVLNDKQLIIGLDENYPPMGYVDENGEIVGFDIDVAQEVCNRLGISLVKKPIDWDEKEKELNSGAIDCIWSGMSVTPEREESMNLSQPYMKNELIFVVTSKSDAKSVSDLEGKTVGVQAGSTTQETIESSALYDKIKVNLNKDNIELFGELTNGTADAVLVDSVVAYFYISRSSEKFYVLPDSFREETLAIGFRKDDQTLRDRVQEIISEMKADGTLREISVKWFGSDITIVK